MTKIVATLGPSSIDNIEQLIESGVNIFRLNFSHADHKTHHASIKKIRETAKKLGSKTAILQDISGPKIRIGEIDGILELNKGDKIRLVKDTPHSKYDLTISYPEIIDDLQVGEYVFFADGTIRAKVIAKEYNSVTLLVKNSGVLSSRKGINFPHSNLSLSAITPKDEKDLRFGAKEGVDIVAISFVNTEQDIEKARKILHQEGANPWLVAKIETKKAVENLASILQASDGVMVARGDLGIEVGIEKVPVIQKRIIKEANRLGKPVITATQMLLSMVNSPFPTRAEVSDVANAVMDGSDAVMLSDETTVGKYPVEAVETLRKVIQETMSIYPFYKYYEGKDIDAIAGSVADLCKSISPKAIVSFTSSGTTVKSIAKYRPQAPIIAVTHDKNISHKLSLVWGVAQIFEMPKIKNPEHLIQKFLDVAQRENIVTPGDRIILTMGSIVGKEGTTNMIRVVEV
ncbi:pyruvate kinase [Nitratiruptor sp. YY08-26]|uniref:pyruvate kinase n=1 Tax=unclassified Nitratiruptor TaxID=2624044 RepID=UPI001916BD7C|nr:MULTISPECIES: pyruvate kinase [unclassified Nitratiruptor]BCD63057.1 pyruvate kinase [Nitratiruptor sp. YY08-13]BCD66992.1 pyruvate kinase [Nitratiruptor sp. YY08-26]